MKKLGIATLTLGVVAAMLPAAARADYAFSGSGASGTLASSSETWVFNGDGGAASTGYLNDWGSPGVDRGVVDYGESSPAYGFEITFAGGGAIDPASVTTGNGAHCAGTTTGGTTFCTGGDIWEAFLTGPDTIEFLAQSAGFDLPDGQSYFVNIFFDGSTPTSFTGSWLTTFSPNPSATPEPSALFLLGSGLLSIAGARRLRRNG
ncbi:MAG TPA: PEP-CTERM sorting domain-containing protein [Acidobacteriaceae bacterium]|nr:PEP-CTERM sorting domain-containing protein [Acidobacteriaceae bacterium]